MACNFGAAMALLLTASVVLGVLPTVTAAERSVVTEYDYDEEGHITSETRTVLTAPPTVDRVEPGFVRRGGERKLTLIGQNLRGLAVTSSIASIEILSVASADNPAVVLSVPDSVPAGVYGLGVSTRLGSTRVNFEVRPPLPDLLAYPLPLEVAVGGSTQLLLSLGGIADKSVELSVSLEPDGIASVEHGALVLPSGQTEFPAIIVSGQVAGQTALRVSAEEFSDLVISLQVLPSSASRLPASEDGESYLVQSLQLGVMNGAFPGASLMETASLASAPLGIVNGAIPDHLLPGVEAVTLAGREVMVMNGITPGHLLRNVEAVTLAGREVLVMNGVTPGHLLRNVETVTLAGREVLVMNGVTPGHLLGNVETVTLAGREVLVMNGPVPGHLRPEVGAAAIQSFEVGVANGPTPEHLRR